MKILHYSLGFPPERSGGLVHYVLDLMKEQENQGQEVLLMYPGRRNFLNKKVYFKSGYRENIKYIELMNSLPLPLIGNIKSPNDFMRQGDKGVFKELLSEIHPDVIHIHTLMGLYKEFLEAAKELKIKLVFTTHDYFGISPNPKFYLNGYDFVDDDVYDIWNNVRQFGSSTLKLNLSQMSFYPFLRKVVKMGKKNKEEKNVTSNWTQHQDLQFLSLKQYYHQMLNLLDVVLYNSNVSKNVYEKFIDTKAWETHVVHVTSNTIYQNGEIILKNNKIKSIAYIGPYSEEKGFTQYVKFAQRFLSTQPNSKAFIMGDDANIQIKSLSNLGRYDKKKFISYLKNIDLVILPSQWHETFGLIGLEALSTTTKIIVTDCMGIADKLPDGLIVHNLNEINIKKIENLNCEIHIDNMKQHCIKILNLY
ncbi:glycosyltransferase [Weissella paramesenteroides]|uniref:glycosyltransferase n=1 Tax=Weissella paramesenteroides TaxID=1249 RepID=UPI003D3608F6